MIICASNDPKIKKFRRLFWKQKKRRVEAVQGVATDLLCCDNLEVTGVQLIKILDQLKLFKQISSVKKRTLILILYTRFFMPKNDMVYQTMYIMNSACWTVPFLVHGSSKRRLKK